MKFVALILVAVSATLLFAQSAQFTVEMRDVDGEIVAQFSEADEGFEVGFF